MAWLPELRKYRQGGADVAIINIGDSNYPLDSLIRMAARIRAFVRNHPDDYAMITDAKSILEIRASGKLAVGLDVEGAYAIGEELELIQLLYDLGVRWMLMAYNRQNLVASGVHDEYDRGLTDFGHKFIAELDRVGVIKCCSHTGYRSTLDVMYASDLPTIFSHSNPRALVNHPRNVTDELIRACAATDGVVCINGVGAFLSAENKATPDLVAEHMDYIAQLVGARYVGIGLDYVFQQQGMKSTRPEQAHIWPPEQYPVVSTFLSPVELPRITECLLRRGWKDEDVVAVLGENLMRVATRVWK